MNLLKQIQDKESLIPPFPGKTKASQTPSFTGYLDSLATEYLLP